MYNNLTFTLHLSLGSEYGFGNGIYSDTINHNNLFCMLHCRSIRNTHT